MHPELQLPPPVHPSQYAPLTPMLPRTSRLHRLIRPAAVLVAGLGLIIAIQLIYPRSYTTPLLRINGRAVGVQNSAQLEQTLQSLNHETVTLQARTKSYALSHEELGSTVDLAASTGELLTYSWKDRLIPFSLFRRTAVPAVVLRHDDARLEQTALKIQKENTLPASNATVLKQKDEYVLDDASQNGLSYDVEQVVATLKATQPGTVKEIQLPTVVIEPAVTTDEARTTIAQLRRQTTQQTYLVVNDKKFLITSGNLKRFIAISYDAKKNILKSTYNTRAIDTFVAEIAAKVYVAPVASTVQVYDGVTVKTTPARDGQQLNEQATRKAVIAALQKGEQTIAVKTEQIQASPQFSRGYSNSNKGLQILLQDWQSDTGLRTGIVVRELGGEGRSASVNGSEQFLAASLAKLYLAHYLYDGAAKGKWSMQDKLGADRPLSGCLEIMIVYSNNNCFNTIGNNRGWNTVAAFAGSQGFTSTNPNPGVYTTTAQDTAWFLQRLHSGSLINATYRSQLISYMSRQIYREGIPTGSRGSVANKVGYWGGYRHDAGIVYHPNSTYVLSILTYGGSPSQIADLARRISNFMDK